MKTLILLLAIAVAVPAAAQSDTIRDRIVQELQDEGFTEIHISKTWLGRMRFEAFSDTARSAFREVTEERFANWELDPTERDVALFAIKGFSTLDMASLRGVSEGTIKAQTAAIYRKAGVSGRSQLLSLFIDELIDSEDD